MSQRWPDVPWIGSHGESAGNVSAAARERVPALTGRRLRGMPLPRPDAAGDKEDRGRVLVVGGAREVPGALVLAGTAVLRTGAGKLQLATLGTLAIPVGVAIPEARVFSLPESAAGGIDPAGADPIVERAEEAEALLLGPGLLDPPAARSLTRAVLARLTAPAVVLDAGALSALAEDREMLRRLRDRVVLTPHAGEMATILGAEREEVERDPLGAARRAAAELRAVVALKGSRTFVVSPGGEAVCYDGGRVGLATSGSGDVLAGIVAGLLGRGADPFRAAAWGVYLHGEAGNVLTRRRGPLGFLARELPDELPPLLGRLGG